MIKLELSISFVHDGITRRSRAALQQRDDKHNHRMALLLGIILLIPRALLCATLQASDKLGPHCGCDPGFICRNHPFWSRDHFRVSFLGFIPVCGTEAK